MAKVKLYGTNRLKTLMQNGTIAPRTCHVLQGEGLETMQDVWALPPKVVDDMWLVPNCGSKTAEAISTLYEEDEVDPVYLEDPYFQSDLYGEERALMERYAAGTSAKKLSVHRGSIHRVIKRWRTRGRAGHPMYQGVWRGFRDQRSE